MAQRSAILLSALALVSCSPLLPAALLASTTLELAPGETVHVVLTLNAAAVVQADMGLSFYVTGETDGAPVFDVVPDDWLLERFVSTGTSIASSGAVRVVSQFDGGDVAALCPNEGDCEIGVTLAMSGNETPASLFIRFGALRNRDRGLFGGPTEFDARATVSLRFE